MTTPPFWCVRAGKRCIMCSWATSDTSYVTCTRCAGPMERTYGGRSAGDPDLSPDAGVTCLDPPRHRRPKPYDDLVVAECAYLRATGWREIASDTWVAPPDSGSLPWGWRSDPYRHGHAVNAQKQFDRFRLRRRP